ncbi:Reticulon-like protein B6 [Datura stramonium]|uniref:Reticulon-like protein B6 n=1 Tax=Datura stramonium TaxID=4076 RepID=A0ABS8V446_DATST|nr:Reticulon-like protein B6 [Datura stramonium]
MAEQAEHSEHKEESLMEKIADKIHFDRSLLYSNFDSEMKFVAAPEASLSSVKDKISRLFGKEKPIHHVFGGGKPADVFLWRNKKVSASVFGGSTAIWVLF